MRAIVQMAVIVATLAVGVTAQAQQMARGFAPFTKDAFKAAADSGRWPVLGSVLMLASV